MNLELKHSNLEYEAKANLRDMWATHHTDIDKYEIPESIQVDPYSSTVYQLSIGVARMVYKLEGENKLRHYINTREIDWQ